MAIPAFVDPVPNCLAAQTSVAEAMRVMTDTGVQIALVTDDERRLLGVVVDSDIRRSLLRQADLSVPLCTIMNSRPMTLPVTVDEAKLRALSVDVAHTFIPLVDDDGRVKGLVNIWRLHHGADMLPNAAVIMAGGRGQRLWPLTADRPKPMVAVGGRPIIETIICNLAADGISRFYLSVNYLADQIIEHCSDGRAWGVSIDYLHEDKPLGTAGALAGLQGRESEPLLVMNGDILTRVSPRALLNFHRQENVMATMAVRPMTLPIPYGVVEIEKNRMISIREKPVIDYYVNAGIYVLNPDIIAELHANQPMDMPNLLDTVPQGGVACYPIPEYWADIGRPDDLSQASREYEQHFGLVPRL